MVEVKCDVTFKVWVYGQGTLEIGDEEARSLYEQLGAVLGALDAETHPKNPERKG